VKRAALLALALIACGAGALAQETRAETRAETRPGEFIYRLPAAGITLDLLAHDAEVATGRTFILTEKSPLRGKTIRLVGEARVKSEEVMTLFQALFVTQGYALKPLGDSTNRIFVVEAIDTAIDLKQRASFVNAADVDAHRHEVGSVIMTFFPLRYVMAANVRNALAPILASKTVEIVLDVQSANALLVFGFAPTIFAIKQLIAAMDVPQPDSDLRFELIELKHSVAEEIEPIVTDLIFANAPAGTPAAAARGGGRQGVPGLEKPAPKVVADPRLNVLAVYAVPSDLAEIRTLVAALDLEGRDPAQNLRIYRLRHKNAEDVAEILNESLGGGSGRSGGSRGGGAGRSPGGEGAPGLAGQDVRDGGGASTGSGSRDVIIVAEPHNNVLLIRASRTRYEELRPLIEQIDRRRPQVMIQGAVAEMTDEQLKSVGAEIMALQGGDNRWRFGGITGFGLSEIGLATSGSLTGSGPGSGTGTGGGGGGPGSHAPPGDPSLFRLPVFPGDPLSNRGGIFGIFKDDLNVPILIQLLEGKQKGSLVSMPVVLANDGAQSTIESGRSIATVGFTAGGFSQSTTTTGDRGETTSFGSGAAGDQFQFSGYQEAKVSLTISPHISNDDYVRLEVELLVEAFVFASTPAESRASRPPDKRGRKLVGSVTIRNGSTVVVGGLVLDRERQDDRGVPGLAQAPLVGPFFRLNQGNKERANVYFFLTPTIISSFDTLDHVSYARKLEILKLQGPVRIIDPDFRPVLLDSHRVVIDHIEDSGNLDMPRYAAIVPIEECGPPAPPPPQDAPPRSR
jgi:general secretion pathway protein D